MGRAAAIAYAREGADVAINYFPTEEPDAQEVIELIKAEGRKAIALPGDLREEAFCQKLVADAVSELGRAGHPGQQCRRGSRRARRSSMSRREDFDATMKTNIYAPFWIIKAALPHLPARLGDHRHDIGAGYDPSPDLYDYAQTKAATMNYVKSLAKQLGPKGIRVNGVAPGSDLDAAAGQRRRDPGEAEGIRRPDAAGPAGPTGGAGLDLCAARSERRQLCHRPGIRFFRWEWPTLELGE